MADLKISQLPAATTPLAGTEVLPIVQGGVTDKVSVADLTAGRAIAATSLTVGAGAVGTPSVTTTGDLNTGVYFPAADTVALTAGGTQAVKAEATAVTAAVPVVLPAGTASAPALTTTGDLNTGVVFSAADTVGVTTGGTQRLTVDTAAVTSTLPVVHPAGAVGTPSVTASGDLDTGAWFPAANTLALSTGGVEALRVTSAQAVIVGNGDAVASPASATIRGTDGSGTNVAGGTVTIQAGRGTGTGAGGSISFATSPAGSSGSTLQTATERMKVDASGNLVFTGTGQRLTGAFSNLTRSLRPSFQTSEANSFTVVQAIPSGTGSAAGFLAYNGSDPDNAGFFNVGSNTTATSIASNKVGTGTLVPLVFTVDNVERVRIDTSGFTHFYSNLVLPYQPAATSKSSAATLTGAELITGILQYTGSAATITLPTGTNIEGALTWVANNVSLDWYVINTGSGTCTIGANSNTTVGELTVTAGTSAHFRIRRTAANTFTVYRL